MNFSKSKYTAFWACPKLCWLQKYKPEEQVIDDGHCRACEREAMWAS